MLNFRCSGSTSTETWAQVDGAEYVWYLFLQRLQGRENMDCDLGWAGVYVLFMTLVI